MEVVSLTSYGSIDEYRQRKEVYNESKFLFYRGTKTNYLLPSIVPNENKLDTKQLSTIEQKLLDDFKLHYTENIEAKDLIVKDWFYRIKSREHGLASRLMDWSHTFYKALDFATYKTNDDLKYKYVYLWILILHIDEIIFQENYSANPFENIGRTIFIKGAIPANQINHLASSRQFVQGGSFLVQPSENIATPLNEQSYFQDKLVCIQIPMQAVPAIRSEILKSGEDINKPILIEENTDMDKICEFLNEKYLYSANDGVIALSST